MTVFRQSFSTETTIMLAVTFVFILVTFGLVTTVNDDSVASLNSINHSSPDSLGGFEGSYESAKSSQTNLGDVSSSNNPSTTAQEKHSISEEPVSVSNDSSNVSVRIESSTTIGSSGDTSQSGSTSAQSSSVYVNDQPVPVDSNGNVRETIEDGESEVKVRIRDRSDRDAGSSSIRISIDGETNE